MNSKCTNCACTETTLVEVYETKFQANSQKSSWKKHITDPSRLCPKCLVGKVIPVQRASTDGKWEMATIEEYDEQHEQFEVRYFDEQSETTSVLSPFPFKDYAKAQICCPSPDLVASRKRSASIAMEGIVTASPRKPKRNTMLHHGGNHVPNDPEYTLERIAGGIVFSPLRLLPSDDENELLRCASINTFGEDIPTHRDLMRQMEDLEFSPKDDQMIFDLYKSKGPAWNLMQKLLSGFAANEIKERFDFIVKTAKMDFDDLPIEGPIIPPPKIPDCRYEPAKQLVQQIRKMLPFIAAKSMKAENHFSPDDFGPFEEIFIHPVTCRRCYLMVPSIQTGRRICAQTKWCHTCTQVPVYVTGNMLRDCLAMRYAMQNNNSKLVTSLSRRNDKCFKVTRHESTVSRN